MLTDADRSYAYSVSLSPDDRAALAKILTSPGQDRKVVARAHTLKLLDDGMSAPDISRWIGVSRTSVYAVAQRFRAGGLTAAVQDGRRTGAPRSITEEALGWIASVIDFGPKAAGVERQSWTVSALQEYVRENGPAAGFPEVASISRSYVWRLMNAGKARAEEREAAQASDDLQTHVLLWRDIEVAFMEGEDGWRPVFRAGIPDESVPGGGFLVLPNSPGLPVPEGAVTRSFIVGFNFEQGCMVVVEGLSSKDQDMIRFLDEVDRITSPDALIELVNRTGPAKLPAGAYKHLFARAGRFAVVQNVKHPAMMRLAIRAVAQIQRNMGIDDVRAPTLDELIDTMLRMYEGFRLWNRGVEDSAQSV